MRTFADDHPDEPAPLRPLRPSENRLDPRRGLPRHPLYYTLDQVASLLNLSHKKLCDSYVWFEGRDTGVYRRRYLRAVNIASGAREFVLNGDWRIPESELLRWLTVNNLWIYDPDSLIENFDIDRGAPFRRALKSETPQRKIVIDESAISAELENPLEDRQ